jgi:hypothetical protein
VKLANCGLNCGFEDIIVVQFGGEIPQFSVIKMHRSLIIKICTAVSNRGLHYALHCRPDHSSTLGTRPRHPWS